MDSTGFDADIFIEAVKNRPVIWNISLPEYHDKIKKRNAWTEVCSVMCNGFEDKSEKEQNELGTKLMKKWKGMRDTFIKSMKKETVSGQGATNRSYIYARQMEFLLHYGISSATTTTSVDEDTETPINERDADPVEERNVAASAETAAGPSSGQRPPLPATPDATTVKNVPTKRTHNASEFSRIPAAKRRILVEENLLKFMNSTPVATPVQQTDDDRSFFESLLPIVKTLPIDTKLEFRWSVMNKLKELRTSVYSVQNLPSTTVLMPIQQQNTLVTPQNTHAPTRTTAKLQQPLSVSVLNQQQQTMYSPPHMLQQQYSYHNISPVSHESQESHMSPSYSWMPSPANTNSQHSSYTSSIDKNMME